MYKRSVPRPVLEKSDNVKFEFYTQLICYIGAKDKKMNSFDNFYNRHSIPNLIRTFAIDLEKKRACGQACPYNYVFKLSIVAKNVRSLTSLIDPILNYLAKQWLRYPFSTAVRCIQSVFTLCNIILIPFLK